MSLKPPLEENHGTTIEGRERYPISVRYARDFREDMMHYKRVLVPIPMARRQGWGR